MLLLAPAASSGLVDTATVQLNCQINVLVSENWREFACATGITGRLNIHLLVTPPTGRGSRSPRNKKLRHTRYMCWTSKLVHVDVPVKAHALRHKLW